MSGTRYTKKLKDFPDIKDYPLPYDPNTEIGGGISALIGNPTLKELTKSHVAYGSPLNVEIPKNYSSSEEIKDPEYAAQLFRQIMSSNIADKLEKSNFSTGDILPNKGGKADMDFLEPGSVRGVYLPTTGKISLDFTRPTKDIMATYAHELGHKLNAQSIGYEGENPNFNLPKRVLVGNKKNIGEPPQFSGTTLDPVGKIEVKDLVNKYWGKHHRADSPNAWEIEALRNLETGKPIREPLTRDLSVEYKNAINKHLNKGK